MLRAANIKRKRLHCLKEPQVRFLNKSWRLLTRAPVGSSRHCRLAPAPAQYCHQGPHNKILSDRGGIGRQPNRACADGGRRQSRRLIAHPADGFAYVSIRHA
jgi:hypothetical protein